MRNQRSSRTLLGLLLSLVLLLGLLPTAALAVDPETGKLPGNPNQENEYDSIGKALVLQKNVEQKGPEAPPAETFSFVLEDTAEGEKHPLSYYGITLKGDLTLSTSGAGEFTKTVYLKPPASDFADHHWKAIPRSGTNEIRWYSKTFLLSEKNDGKPGWTYSKEEYALTFWYDIKEDYMRLDIHMPGNDVYYRSAKFINTYDYTSYTFPFTKTVQQGGTAAPGKQSFSLELFDVGYGAMNAVANDYCTATVQTKGAGSYDGKLVLSGPTKTVEDIVCEGFMVREKQTGAANWTYSDATYRIVPNWEGGERTFEIYPAEKQGDHYVDAETPVKQMAFTNTYTANSDVVTITARKTDALGKALGGATFVLKDSRGKEVYQTTSGTDGVIRFNKVSDGTYTLMEKAAPAGYVASDEAYVLTVSDGSVTMGQKAYSPVTFVNRKATALNRDDHFAFLVGYPGGTFGPERNMTRAEVTTMFARLLTEKLQPDKSYPNTFTDVPGKHWAANYIGYMQQFGIVTGFQDGSFRPDEPVTRAQFAAIASRFEKLTAGTKSFTDVPGTHWAAKYVNFAATRGWVNGYADGSFRPENPIIRTEVAAVTCRLLERSADQSYIRAHLSELNHFRDMTEGHWAYWYVMEAANGHDYTKTGGSETWTRTHP